MLKKFTWVLMCVAAIIGATSCNWKDQGENNDRQSSGRMDRSKLNIGAYILQPYAQTENHIKDLADCGVDFVVCMNNNREALDLLTKYNVGAVVSGVLPGWWGGDGNNAGKMAETNPMSKYEDAAAKFEDHPAIWGIDMGDEPSALDFPYYGKVAEKCAELFPNQFGYLNLYPNYASVATNNGEQTVNQLGTTTYAEHIDAYCKNVQLDYLCFDFYVYAASVKGFYDNLKVVTDACHQTGRSMWIVLQVNSHVEDKWISLNQLRYQAYASMAFGPEVITWACYTAGWWHNQVLDKEGNKTQQYDKLKQMNSELHTIGESYMKYKNVETVFVDFEGTDWLEGLDVPTVSEYTGNGFENVGCGDDAPLLVGAMQPRTGKKGSALFVCAADDPYDENPAVHILSFKAKGKVTVTSSDGVEVLKKSRDGIYNISIASSQGILIEAR